MREFLFRAWDEDLEKWALAGEDFELWTDDPIIFSFDVNRDEYIVEQYSGLKDKNNIRIFEGDILKVPDSHDDFGINAGEIYQVYFAYGGFRFKPKRDLGAKGFWLEDDKEFEIIGNIHENPELLP